MENCRSPGPFPDRSREEWYQKTFNETEDWKAVRPSASLVPGFIGCNHLSVMSLTLVAKLLGEDVTPKSFQHQKRSAYVGFTSSAANGSIT
jgi:hypothetical protein